MSSKLILATLLAAVPAIAHAEYAGHSLSETKIVQYQLDNDCGPVIVSIALLEADGKVAWRGKKRDLEEGSLNRGDTSASTLGITIQGYDADCQPTFSAVSSGGFYEMIDLAGSSPEITESCLDDPGSTSTCEPVGVKHKLHRASIHGTFTTSDGRTLRVDLDLDKTDRLFIKSRVRANPVRIVARATIQGVPVEYADIPDSEIDETFENPDRETVYRQALTMREADVAGTITLDGVDLLGGASPLFAIFMNVKLDWRSPSAEFAPELPF